MAARWLKPQSSSETALALQQSLQLHPLVAAILARRGYGDVDRAREFLQPRFDSLHDPFLMAGMREAARRLLEAIRRSEPVLLYGDYDVDGTCSVVILKKAIEILGGRADFHIPHRVKDGYGMRSEVIGKAAEAGIRLIVSVDTGIRATEVVRHANGLGIDVIVTDHHLPEAEIPPALAVLNPNRHDCAYPNKHLCGAGVTLKLVQAILSESDLPESRRLALLRSFIKPAAIATVADIVPLTGENRVIVKAGLSGLRNVRNPGLRALLSVAGFEPGECPSAHQVAFRLAPRINAAGRMATARDVVELFLTENDGRAQILSEQLDALNRERQKTEAEIVEAIVQECEAAGTGQDGSALVFARPGWHLGVLGIVASRLVERFCRPTFVLSESADTDESGARYFAGSGRSIPAFHLLEALESMPELFRKFGGHRQAAGLSLRQSDLEQFRQKFESFAAGKLIAEDFQPRYQIDVEAALSQLTDDCAAQILALGPFGFGNAPPLLCCRGLCVAETPRALGSEKHLLVRLRQNGCFLTAKAWRFGHRADLFEAGATIDALLEIEDDPYSRKRGYRSWCLSIKDARRSEAT